MPRALNRIHPASFRRLTVVAALTLSVILCPVSPVFAAPLGTAFTYQGRLNDGGSPASGLYDLKFTVNDAATGVAQVGAALTNATTPVSNGLFTVTLDFGAGVFTGSARWLEIGVRASGSPTNFTPLTPRQALNPAPYALHAPSAGTAASATVANSVAAANITGTLPDARLSANVPLLNGNARFAGTVSASRLSSDDKVFWGAGSELSGDQGGSIELGNSLLTNTVPFIDFHYGVSSNEDFNMRLINNGPGRLEIGSPLSGYTPWLRVQDTGNVAVDPSNRNEGGSLVPGLTFGVDSGEGIASKRSPGGNQWGLDLFTSFQPRVSIANNGYVGIGKTNPATTLDVNGTINATALTGLTGLAMASCTNSGVHSLAVGDRTLASGENAVALGIFTKATAYHSIAGGAFSIATNNEATALGLGTVAGGQASTSLGINSQARGQASLAAGNLARALHDFSFVWADGQAGNYFETTARNQFLIRAAGGVGIGKDNPASALDVNGTVTALSFAGNIPAANLTGTLNAGQLPANVARLDVNQTFTGGCSFAALNAWNPSGAGGSAGSMHVGGYTADGTPKLINFGDGAYVYLGENGLDDTMELRAARFFFNEGNVGLGGTPGSDRLDIRGSTRINDNDIYLRAGGDNNHGLGWYGNIKPFAGENVDGPVLYGWSGGALGTTGTGQSIALKWNASGNVTIGKTLTIAGGSDVAEPFPMSTPQVPKGSVVVIDDEHPGQLKQSERAYDTRVAGIVSGANGINTGLSLHQEGALEGGQQVALSGRVYVLADATNGVIKPGDLLTTSDVPGHAMKVTDHTRSQGAVLGKAMTALAEGQGMVLVLVTLQ